MSMRGKRRIIPILLLLATAVLSQSLITPSAELEYPAIYIDPATIGPNGYGIDTQFNISIRTDCTYTDITGYGFSLTYNPLVLEGVEVFNGDLITAAEHTMVFSAGNFTHYTGKLALTEATFTIVPLQPVNVTSGPGILAKVTFKVVGNGDSDIILGNDTFLKGYNAVTKKPYNIVDAYLMPENIGHSYFRNVEPAPTHDIAVTSVEPDVTKVLAPAPVSINVTIENSGTADERFAVKVYYEKIHAEFLVGSMKVDNLTAGDFWSQLFIWDTTYAAQGNHTIIAVADEVMRETNTANNKNEEAWVVVYSPYIAVVPKTTINPDAATYTVSICTDYNATEVVGSNDVSRYEFTLNYNASVLEGSSVDNGGGMPMTDTWVGDNSKTIYYTTKAPVVDGTETVYVNGTKMKKGATKDYTIVYSTGEITFTTAPDWVLIEVEYLYTADLMPGATFTAGNFDNVNGVLSLTSASVATPVSGPGALAAVTFNVVGIGESDIVLGTGTKLKRSDESSITMPNRLIPGYFTNMGDAAMLQVKMATVSIVAYESWSVPVNITVETQNVWGAPNFTAIAYYGKAGVEKQAGNQTVTNLAEGAKETVTINWYLTGVPFGQYVVSAGVVVPTGDHNPLNDQDSDGTVLVKIPGDIDGNAIVNSDDFLKFGLAFGSTPAATNWNEQADFDRTNKVDSIDFLIFGLNFGESTTEY